MNKVKCVADRSYNKADDMHQMASIKSRLDKGLKPLLQPIALKKLDGDPQFDYSVEDGRRRFTALTNLKLTEIELGQEAILSDGDSEINAYLATQPEFSTAQPYMAYYDDMLRFHPERIPRD